MRGSRVITPAGNPGTVHDHDEDAGLVQVAVDSRPGLEVYRVCDLVLQVTRPIEPPSGYFLLQVDPAAQAAFDAEVQR